MDKVPLPEMLIGDVIPSHELLVSEIDPEAVLIAPATCSPETPVRVIVGELPVIAPSIE
jgi:hypothetical protein